MPFMGLGLGTDGAAAIATAARRQPVASIAALKALTPSAGDAVNTLGYYAAGDGGGGTFYYDAAASAADNDASRRTPTGAPPPTPVRRHGRARPGSPPRRSYQRASALEHLENRQRPRIDCHPPSQTERQDQQRSVWPRPLHRTPHGI